MIGFFTAPTILNIVGSVGFSITVSTVEMRIFNFISAETCYKSIIFTLKIFGFVFFKIKNSSTGIKFERKSFEFSVFLTSLSLSLYVLIMECQQGKKLETKSPILSVSMVVIYRISLIGIVVAKIAFMMGSRKAFNVILFHKSVDKKVRVFSSLSLYHEIIIL